jgi:predicted small lipoprotein YifL
MYTVYSPLLFKLLVAGLAGCGLLYLATTVS